MVFPATVLPIRSEIFIDGAWTNVTSKVDRDGGNGITISGRGRRNEARRTAPATAALRFKNQDDYFSYQNPESVNYEKLGPNTPFRTRLMWAYDDYDRTAASSWGTGTSGVPWTVSGGLASDYSVGGSKGTMTLTSVGAARTARISMPVSTDDAEFVVSPSAVATGAPLGCRVELAASTGINDGYYAWLLFKTDGTVTARIVRLVGGVATTLVADQTIGTYVANTEYYVRLKRNSAGYICLMARPASGAEGAWTLVTGTPDLTHTDLVFAYCWARSESGNTNVNPQFKFSKFATANYRFYGEVPSWKPQTDDTGRKKWVDAQVGDAMRRYTAGAKSLNSALFSTISGVSPGDLIPVDYWAMEEDPDATIVAGSLPSTSDGVVSGDVTFGSYSGVPGSRSLPTLSPGGYIAGRYQPMPGLTTASVWQLQFVMMIPSAPASSGTIAEWSMNPATNNTATRMRLYYDTTFPGGELALEIYAGSSLLGTARLAVTGFPVANPPTFELGTPYMFAITQFNNGGNLTTVFGQYNPAYQLYDATIALSQQTSTAWGGATSVPNELKGWSYQSSTVNGLVIGHHSVYNDPALLTVANVSNNTYAMSGHESETAADRIVRLGQEIGAAVTVFGDPSASAKCGVQLDDTFLNNCFSAAEADQGLFYASRDFLGFEYRTKKSMHNQTAATLDYASQQLKIFRPLDDDRYRANFVRSRRIGGSSSTYEVTTGRNSTQEPPNGVGTYQEDLAWNLYQDSQLPLFASYRALLGTWDAVRLDAVGVWMERSQLAATPTGLFSQIGRLDLGEFLDVSNPPSYLPPDDIESIIQGYTEVLANFEWHIAWNVVPSGPYRVWVLGEGRLQAAASTTSGSFNAGSGTSLTVVSPRAVFSNASTPFQVMVGGALLNVTVVTGATSPQVLTVDAATLNGVTKTIPSGTAVKVYRPLLAG